MMALGGVTYLDRVGISILAPSIMKDLAIDSIQMSYIFSAFTFAYAIFEMPTAWWADRVGSRKVLTRIVVWWSAFTMLTATDRKSTRLNSSHIPLSRMPSSA